jgi:phosphate transport system substrate-binding protein
MHTTRNLAALLAALAGAGAAMAADANKLVIDGSTTVGPIAKAFAEHYMKQNPGIEISVSESGSGNGAKALINGTCDIADMSRHMKDTEKKVCAEKGIVPFPNVVAHDALPIVVHPSNPVKGLTLAQLADIYTNKVTNWKAVGGVDMPIVVISRDTSSGTYESFKELALPKDAKIKSSAEYVGSNGGIRQRVQTTPGAIGYAGLGFVDATVKALEIEGVAPSADTALDGTYKLSRPLFMYTNGEPKPGTHLANFIALAKTPKGREIIEEIGFIPVPEIASRK